MEAIYRTIEKAMRRLSVVSCWVLLSSLLIVSLYDLIGRMFINTGSTALQELQWHFLLALVFINLGPVYLIDRHVRIDVLRRKFSARTIKRVEIAGFVLCILPLAAMLIFYGGKFALRSYGLDEGSRAAMGLPNRWIIKSLVPLGGLLFLISGIGVILRPIGVVPGTPDEPDKIPVSDTGDA